MNSPKRFPARAVLFDLDGTLLDTIEDLAEAANRMLEEMRRPPRSRAEIHRFVGKGLARLVQRCLGEDGLDPFLAEQAQDVFRRHYRVINGRHARIYLDVVETLTAMAGRGLKLACVTNKPTEFTQALLTHTDLARYFQAVICGDTLAVRKPDPAVLIHACSKLGVPPVQALMIGDSENDAKAARAAGIPVLLVTYGYSEGIPVDTIECDGLLSSARQALDRIDPIRLVAAPEPPPNDPGISSSS